MRALVTGGAGFIGSTLVDRLLAEGHTVDVVDDLSTGRFANLADARAAGSHQLTFQPLDAGSADLAAVIERRRPDVVYHLAARVDPAQPVGTGGVHRVLEGVQAGGGSSVVFVSSAIEVYRDVAPADLPAREAGPSTAHGGAVPGRAGPGPDPLSADLLSYCEGTGLEVSFLVIGHVYGPRQEPQGDVGVVAVFARQLLAGAPCTIHGDGDQTRDFVFIDDVVDAFARAAGRGGGLLVNVGTGVETSINQLYATLAAAAGVEAAAHHVPAVLCEVRRSALDGARAASQLGWEPWTSLREGAAATVDWYRSGVR